MKTETLLQSQQIPPSKDIEILLDADDAVDPDTGNPALHLSYEIHSEPLGNGVTVEHASSNSGLHFQSPPGGSHNLVVGGTVVISDMMICSKHRLRVFNPGPDIATVTITRAYRSN